MPSSSVLLPCCLLSGSCALVAAAASASASAPNGTSAQAASAAGGGSHLWYSLADGFPTRVFVFFLVIVGTVSLFLLIAALGPKNRFYEYRRTELKENLSLDLDDDDEEEGEVLFDAGQHKLLKKAARVA